MFKTNVRYSFMKKLILNLKFQNIIEIMKVVSSELGHGWVEWSQCLTIQTHDTYS